MVLSLSGGEKSMSNSAMVDQKGRLKIPRDPPFRAQEGSDTEFYITSEDGSSFCGAVAT